MLAKTFLATTAPVLCVATCAAAQVTGKTGEGTPARFATSGRPAPLDVAFEGPDRPDSNVRFLSWFGRAYHVPPRRTDTVLYDQSASSGFAKYAIASWQNDSAYGYGASVTFAADDFIIPGSGAHSITAVYAAGVIEPVDDLAWVNVTFFSKLKYNRQTQTTTAVVKAQCLGMPFTDQTGTGDLMVDVTSCNAGPFKAGHDYAVSVQPESADLVWYWQTNRKRLNRPGFWWDGGGGGNGSCYTQFTPIKICYPTKGYGPDLAFAIYGN